MYFRDTKVIVAIIAAGVAVISLAFIWLTPYLLFPASIGLIVSSGIYTIIQGKRYIAYKNKMREIFYEDAFNYADEIGDPKAMYAFRYPKDVAKKLKTQKFNMWLKMAGPMTILMLAIMLLFAGLGMIVGG